VADYAPVYAAGVLPFTSTTSGAVVGGNVLVWSGSGTVAAAGADSIVVAGVAAHDAASGAKVTVWPMDGVVHELVATAAITAGAGVVTDAVAGQVKTATIATAAAAGSLIGTAATTAAGSPLKLRVHGRR
jgi:hypothetical protein